MAGHTCFPCSQPAVPSLDGHLIAVVDHSHLLVRSSEDGAVKQSYDLPPGFETSSLFIRWNQAVGNGGDAPGRARIDTVQDAVESRRLLLADDARIMVYDINKPQVFAEISGATGLTKLADVDFGRTFDEVMVFSDFGFKLQIWSLTAKRAIEVKDPKPVPACYSYRPTTGHLALLTRPAARDILMIIAPHTHEVLETSELPTVDARGVKYSPDGNWLVIWDSASSGCRVLVLTADAHLFKTYSLPQDELNLGVTYVQWSPTSECLAIGDYEGKITILGKNTFTPIMTFVHQATIDSPHESVWQEEIGPSRTRGYTRAKQPAVSPSHESFRSAKGGDTGITMMEFNLDGSLLVSKCSDTPSTLRIFSPRSGQPLAALIHHAPIKSIQWHDKITNLLLVQCSIREPTVYVWRASWRTPKIFSLPLRPPFGQSRASWLSSDHGSISYVLGNTDQFALGRFTPEGEEASPHSNGAVLEGLGPEDMFDEGHSLDLSPIGMSHDGALANDTPALGLSTQLGFTSAIEDTFHYRRQSQAVP